MYGVPHCSCLVFRNIITSSPRITISSTVWSIPYFKDVANILNTQCLLYLWTTCFPAIQYMSKSYIMTAKFISIFNLRCVAKTIDITVSGRYVFFSVFSKKLNWLSSNSLQVGQLRPNNSYRKIMLQKVRFLRNRAGSQDNTLMKDYFLFCLSRRMYSRVL